MDYPPRILNEAPLLYLQICLDISCKYIFYGLHSLWLWILHIRKKLFKVIYEVSYNIEKKNTLNTELFISITSSSCLKYFIVFSKSRFKCMYLYMQNVLFLIKISTISQIWHLRYSCYEFTLHIISFLSKMHTEWALENILHYINNIFLLKIKKTFHDI